MKLLNKIFLLFLLLIPVSFSHWVWVSVDAWTDWHWMLINQKILLNWSVSWIWTSCSVSYYWIRNGWPWATITIYNPTSLNWAYFYWPSETVWWQNIDIDLSVSVSGCAEAWVYTDTVSYSVDPNFLNSVAWDDITVAEQSTVNLSWNHYWAIYTCSTPTYQWTQTWSNMSIDLFDEASSSSKQKQFSFTAPSVWSTQTFQIEFTTNCSFSSKTDVLNLTITKTLSSWSSRTSQAVQIADKIFNQINIDWVKLVLTKNEFMNWPSYEYIWNDLWWDWLIKYEFEMSSWKDFKTYQTYTTYFNKMYIVDNHLFKNHSIVYLRVRALYNWKSTLYSNVLMHVDLDKLLLALVFKKWWKSKMDYKDVLNRIILKVDEFNLKKTKKAKKIDFNDYLKIPVQDTDSFSLKKTKSTKKINFSDLNN